MQIVSLVQEKIKTSALIAIFLLFSTIVMSVNVVSLNAPRVIIANTASNVFKLTSMYLLMTNLVSSVKQTNTMMGLIVFIA